MKYAIIIHRSDLMQLAIQALLTDALKAHPFTVDRYFSLDAALPALRTASPNFVVFEDQPQGIGTAREIHVVSPHTWQIVMGTATDCDFIGGLFKAGIAAYLHLHDSIMKGFPTAVRLVQMGRTYLSPLVSADYKALVGSRCVKELDSRAVNVLLMLIAGRSIHEIMEHLAMSQDTVYRIRARLRRWFGVETNEAVIERAIAQGYGASGGVV